MSELTLPQAKSKRWQPLRSGLMNIYRYDYQEFWYESGRLVLRGNNGTGKSRVLALQLPFLLDGEIVPQRVEPDGDSAKRMEWNLLMGGKYDDRQGYTWIEFGRVDENGTELYQTLGCGLRAAEGRGIAQQWFFITRQRIGKDLYLQNEQRVPHSKAKLEALVGDNGKIFGSGKVEDDRGEYRQAVDKTLFELGDRYEALLSLLIQLRQPQLSRKLNEQVLSNALSEALPPLPESVLGDVADAFRRLEDDRQELNGFIAARDSANTFLDNYRNYVRIAARRKADVVRSAHAAYESTMRRLRGEEEKLAQAQTDLDHWNSELERLIQEESRAKVAEETLRNSPEMKSAHELDVARTASKNAEQDEQAAEKDASNAYKNWARESEAFQIEQDKVDRALNTVRTCLDMASRDSSACQLEAKHSEQVELAGLPDSDEDRIQSAAKIIEELIKQKFESIGLIEKLNNKIKDALQEVATAQAIYNAVEQDLNTSRDKERAAREQCDSEIISLYARYRTWAETVILLIPASPDEVEPALGHWCETLHGESPLAISIRLTNQLASEKIATRKAEITTRLNAEREHLEILYGEQAQLQNGHETAPPIPYTRSTEARSGQRGAPLWQVCDFLPEVTDAERSGIEAALEASGLLDAWITPDGHMEHAEREDIALAVNANQQALEASTLNAVLAPDASAFDKVPEAVISAILHQIGFGANAGNVWIDATGRWQIGPLHGKWTKLQSQYIGQSSREAARQRRLQELQQEIESAESKIAGLKNELELVEQQIKQLRDEVASAPNDRDVRQAFSRIEDVREEIRKNQQRLTEKEEQLNRKRKNLTDATEKRNAAATDLNLTPWMDRAEEFRGALHDYRQCLTHLWSESKSYFEVRHRCLQTSERLARYDEERNLRQSQYQERKKTAIAAAEKFRILQSTVGKSVEEVMRQLKEATDHSKLVEKDKDDAQEKKTTFAINKKGYEATIIAIRDDLKTKEQNRGVIISEFQLFAKTKQLSVAHDDLAVIESGDWSATYAIDLARKIESLLEEVDHSDNAWDRHQKSIYARYQELESSLRTHNYQPELTNVSDLVVVSVQFQGRECTIAELRNSLIGIIQDRQDLLDAKEREVLENYLIADVADRIHDLLHAALKWKEKANEELESRPMDTGMTLRFTWDLAPDSPPAFVDARKILLHTSSTWSPEQRKIVGEFLQQQIKVARSQDETGTWQDHLAAAFDYRKWHQFGVERRQEGVWKRLTKRTHGTGSGGEKAIALTLPQLAAAAAHYRSAGPHAPRLILLDEAFVGVDKNMRAKCMDLLCAFDLDVVMTSESEWACYPTVPAIAIYQLSAREGIDAVYASRWVWNGRQRTRDNIPLPNAEAPPVSS